MIKNQNNPYARQEVNGSPACVTTRPPREITIGESARMDLQGMMQSGEKLTLKGYVLHGPLFKHSRNGRIIKKENRCFVARSEAAVGGRRDVGVAIKKCEALLPCWEAGCVCSVSKAILRRHYCKMLPLVGAG